MTKRGFRTVRGLVRCAHPKQAVVLATALGLGAVLADRPGTEVLLVAAAVLTVQLSLGLSNDLCDQRHDLRSEAPHKPLAQGHLRADSAHYWMLVLILVSFPLAAASSLTAGAALLLTLPIGWIHNRWLHRTAFSFLGWTLTFALLPAFLAYGGNAGKIHGDAPTWEITLAAAAVGFAVHFATSLGDLVTDNKSGARNLPLLVALRTGAPRLLLATIGISALAAAGLVAAALSAGLIQGR